MLRRIISSSRWPHLSCTSVPVTLQPTFPPCCLLEENTCEAYISCFWFFQSVNQCRKTPYNIPGIFQTLPVVANCKQKKSKGKNITNLTLSSSSGAGLFLFLSCIVGGEIRSLLTFRTDPRPYIDNLWHRTRCTRSWSALSKRSVPHVGTGQDLGS